MTNGKVLVIGSEFPWIEPMLLELGARHVITLEYNAHMESSHPNITLATPSKLVSIAF